MSREESPREDLIREATALVERIEISFDTSAASIEPKSIPPVIIGFRANGALSIFFGEDPVYQFNSGGELRRAYWGGRLFKADRGRLVSLERRRTTQEVQLVRYELTDAEQNTFMRTMEGYLQSLANRFAANEIRVERQAPPEVDVLSRVGAWFATHTTWPVATQPNA
jgi:hypothetical protein